MPADRSTLAVPGAATRLAVDVRRLPWIRPLVGDYASRFSQLAQFFSGDPQVSQSWRSVAAQVHQHERRRTELQACIASQQHARNAPPAARASAERLGQTNTLAVVTGQQAGAFGGPLYTLLKAIGALQLARRAEASLGCPVVPVFWIDAEDHDWEEVATCTVLDPQLEPQAITLARPEGAGELPVGALRLTSDVHEGVRALTSVLPQTEFSSWIADLVSAAYAPGASMADAFARLLESILGPHGLVVFDSSDLRVKPLVADVFEKELTGPGTTSALAIEAGEALAAAGHAPQVTPQPDSVALFRLNTRRNPIRRDGETLLVGEERLPADALAREAASNPERFSPNVLLRPIVQDTLLPTVCYVAGPSELAYLGQLRRVYERFGVPMPLIHPRASATLVDAATVRFLNKYDVPLEDLQPRDESRLNRLLESQLPPAVEDALKNASDTIANAMQRVVEAMPAVDPTLVGAAKTTTGKIEHELRALHGKLLQALKRRDETLRRQFARAQALTFPHGKPQERTIGTVYFLNQYGPALVDRLLEELPLEPGQHWVISI